MVGGILNFVTTPYVAQNRILLRQEQQEVASAQQKSPLRYDIFYHAAMEIFYQALQSINWRKQLIDLRFLKLRLELHLFKSVYMQFVAPCEACVSS